MELVQFEVLPHDGTIPHNDTLPVGLMNFTSYCIIAKRVCHQ